jgi:hypothetical protein
MDVVPEIDRLTQIFSNAIAPAFFLGAVAAFVSLMMSRLATVHERIKATRALPDQHGASVGSRTALGMLTRRARLLSDGIILSLGGVCARRSCLPPLCSWGLPRSGSRRKLGIHGANWWNSD